MNTPAIIIGSGPAGLSAAAVLQKLALILEKGPKPGRKLLLSGAGQCNFTHDGGVEELLKRYHQGGRFLKPALYAYPPQTLINDLQKRGVAPFIRDDGKVFPASLKAGDVLNAMLGTTGGAEMICGQAVERITLIEEGFLVQTPAGTHQARTVLLACGGYTWPGTGSSGDGFTLAAALGHKIVPPRPALTPVYPEAYSFGELSGISVEAGIKGPRKLQAQGPLLLTRTGFSGPLILDNSRCFNPGDAFTLDFLPLKQENIPAGAIRVKTHYCQAGLPERLVLTLMQLAGLPGDLSWGNMTRGGRQNLQQLIHSYPVTVKTLGGINEAMVTAGGVSLDQVDPRTMQSRLVPGLFLAGEVLDYDGQSGGYNIQAACSTGHVAGTAMASFITSL